MSALLEVDNLSKQFVTRSGLFKRTVKEAELFLRAWTNYRLYWSKWLWQVNVSAHACWRCRTKLWGDSR